MKTIAFLNIKGGVGKTTTATTISHIMATVYKKKVLLIDLDHQANATSTFYPMDDNFEEMFIRLFVKEEIYGMDNTIATLIANPNKDIHDCIRHTDYENLDIIPSDLQLTTVENILKADTLTPQQFKLKAHLERIEDEYDYCILDCSPSVGLININGLAWADEVYVPIRADAYSIGGLAFARDLVRTVATYNSKLKLSGTFFVSWEDNNCSKILYQLFEKYAPQLLIPIKIRKSKLLAENTVLQAPLYELDHGKNMSKATKSYLQLAEYMIAENKEEYLNTIKTV